MNFSLTREIVSAGRAHGLDFGFEPAGPVTAEGNVARLYNTTASGGIHFFTYKGNLLDSGAAATAFRRHVSLLQRRTPQVHAALYLPKTAWALDEGSLHRVLAAAQELRRCVDFEMLDRTTITAPLAKRIRVLAIAEADFAEPEEIENLRQWVEAGGILVARSLPDRPLLRTPEGSDAARNAILATPPANTQLYHGAAGRGGELDRSVLAACTRNLGKGATLAVACRDRREFHEAVIQALEHPEILVPGARGISLPIIGGTGKQLYERAAGDDVFATQLDDGLLYYNASDHDRRVDGVDIPAHGIRRQATTLRRSN